MNSIFRKYRAKRKKGFTLLEVLVVVVILGVLATIAVPTYNKIVRRSRVADGLNVLDMLAGAQDKYFIQHGIYAAKLTDLNIPMKDYRSENPQAQFANIITKNFTYDKIPEKNCIYATSNTGTNYTLVKNYKSNAKVRCVGEGCKDLTGYVDETSDIGSLCPAVASGEPPCEEEECPEGEHFDSDACKCFPDAPQPSVPPANTGCPDGGQDGDTRPYNTGEACGVKGCYLWTTQVCKDNEWIIIKNIKPECKDAQGNACQENQGGNFCTDGDTQYVQTEESCTSSSLGRTGGLGNAGGDIKCGIKYVLQECVEKQWVNTEKYDCRQKECQEGVNLVLNPETCECESYKECNPAEIPVCSNGVTICDPCPESPSTPNIIQQALAGVSGNSNDKGGNDRGAQTNPEVSTECFHCGYRNGSTTPECNHSTGRWYCAGDENTDCTNISGGVFAYDPDRGNCDGSGTEGNACGGYELTNIRCFQEITGGIPELSAQYSGSCSLKTGNACFSGETRECTLQGGGSGVQQCKDCQWDEECNSTSNCDPGNKPQGNACGTYECNETSHAWEWVPANGTVQCNPDLSSTQLAALGIESCSANCQATCKGGSASTYYQGKCYEAYWNSSLNTAVFGDGNNPKKTFRVYNSACGYTESGVGRGGDGDGGKGGGRGDVNFCEGCYTLSQVYQCTDSCVDWNQSCVQDCYSQMCGVDCLGAGGTNNNSPSTGCLNVSCSYLTSAKSVYNGSCADYCKGQTGTYCLSKDRIYKGAQENTSTSCNPSYLPGFNVGVYWCRIAGTNSTGSNSGSGTGIQH